MKKMKVSKCVCQNWFANFRGGNTTCEDSKRSGRPLVVDNNQVKTSIENNQRYITRISEIVNISQKTVVNHLRERHLCISVRYLLTIRAKKI